MSEDKSQQDQASSIVTELQKLLSAAQEIITQLDSQKNTILSNVQDASQQLGDLKGKQQSLGEQLAALEAQRSTAQGLMDAITALKAEAENNKNSVLNDVQAITQTKAQFEELKTQAQTARDDLANRQSELAGKISEINGAYDRISQQQKVLFDDSTDQSGTAIRAIVNQIHDSNTAIKGLLAEAKRESEASTTEIKQALEESKTKITALNESVETKLKEVVDQSTSEISALKKSLEQEIKSLLPEAGAAGLASTFFQAKSKYAITASEPKSKYLVIRLGLQLLHFLLSALTPLFFYAMFILPLGGIFYIFYSLLPYLEKQTSDGSIIHIDSTILLYRLLLSLPLAWVSLFGWSSIRMHRRLYEEYNYKQRVMQLYHSFKDEIGTEDGENQKALLGIMLAAVADKPSLAMNQYDNSGKGLLSEIGISDFIKRALGKITNSNKTT